MRSRRATILYSPRCIKFAFERKSEKSNATWVLTNQNRALRTCVWFFWLAFKRNFYPTGSHVFLAVFNRFPPWWSLPPRSPSHICKLLIHRVLLFLLLQFPFILPVKTRFSRPPFRSACPKNLICLAPHKISFLSTSAFSKYLERLGNCD